jgi:hypothetical protein
LQAVGYDEDLCATGNRPETTRWHRSGAQQSDLAIRGWLWTGLKVVYEPNIMVEDKVRRELILSGGAVRRALHVGHNRAYVHSRYPRVGVVNDYQTFKRLVKELTFIAKKFLGDHIVCGKVGTSTYKNHILLIPRYLDDRDMAVVLSAAYVVMVPYNTVSGSGVSRLCMHLKNRVIHSNIPSLVEDFRGYERATSSRAGDVQDLGHKLVLSRSLKVK